MRDSTLIATGIVGAALAVVCCATPLLALAAGAVGLAAWSAETDYVVMPALVAFFSLAGFGLHHRTRTG